MKTTRFNGVRAGSLLKLTLPIEFSSWLGGKRSFSTEIDISFVEGKTPGTLDLIVTGPDGGDPLRDA